MTVIDDIKLKLDIVEIISSYVALQKAGRNYKAMCPFHTEKTPSFFVFPDKQSWHCFGSCSTGGDLFTFVMKKNNVDFSQALTILADKAGVSLEREQGETRQERDILYRINEAAASKFHWFLFNLEEAKKALKYFKNRGLSEKTIEDFQLGFAPDSWDAMKNHLSLEGFKTEDLEKVALIKTSEGGKKYDTFRNRIIFPIKDQRGKVLGFGSRVLDDSQPKYLNSPQSPIFDKGGALYGLDRAGKSIEKNNQVVVVEGYFDVILAHQYNFQNTVASMGTALTARQLKILQKLTKNIVLALDPDAAGEKAMLMGLETASQSLDTKVVPVIQPGGSVSYIDVLDAELKVLVLPEAKDPDEFIIENPDRWPKLVLNALSASEYLFKACASGLNLNTMEGRETALAKISPFIKEVKEPLRRAYYLKQLASLLQVDTNYLLKLFPSSSQGLSKGPSAGKPSFLPARRSYEEYCLNLLFRYPQVKEKTGVLIEDFFQFAENRELYLAWKNIPDPDIIKRNLDPALASHLEAILSIPVPPVPADKTIKHFLDCVSRLKQEYIKSLKVKEQVYWSNSDISYKEKEIVDKKLIESDEQLKVIETTRELGEVFNAQEVRRRAN